MWTRRSGQVALLMLCAAVAAACEVPTRSAPVEPTVTVEVSVLAGTVRHAHSQAPVSGALVTASVAGIQRTSVTDGGGAYRLAALPSGVASVRVERDGFVTTRTDVLLSAPEVEMNLTVAPATPPPEVEFTTLAGAITNAQTLASITGATVTVTLESGASLTATTTMDGRFSISNVPLDESIDLRVEANNYMPEFRRVQVARNMQVQIALTPIL